MKENVLSKYSIRFAKSFMTFNKNHFIGLFDSSEDFCSDIEKLDPCIYCGDNILGVQINLNKDNLKYFNTSTIQAPVRSNNMITSETSLILKVIKNDELVVKTQISLINPISDKKKYTCNINDDIVLINLDLRQYNLKTIRHGDYVRFEFCDISGNFKFWLPYITVICEYEW